MLARRASQIAAAALALLLCTSVASALAVDIARASGVCGCSGSCACGSNSPCGDGCTHTTCDCECGHCGVGGTAGSDGNGSVGDLLAELLDWLFSLPDIEPNEVSHILADSHHWDLLVPGQDWNGVAEILFDVYENGAETGEHEKSMVVDGYTVVVTHGTDSNTGNHRIGIGWVVVPG